MTPQKTRILWFSNYLPPELAESLGIATKSSGHWVATLLDQIRKDTDYQLALATTATCTQDRYRRINGVDYFLISKCPSRIRLRDYDQALLKRCVAVVENWKPDLLHIHGSEYFYGLLGARRLVSQPVLISLQGVVSAYHRIFWGNLSLRDRLRCHSLLQLLTARGLNAAFRAMTPRMRTEGEVLSGNHYFAGRTTWDLAQLRSFNPDASYFHVGELLRPSFSAGSWSLEHCRPHSIIFTNADMPRRGMETLLEASANLRQDVRDLRLILAGRWLCKPYQRFLLSRIHELGLDGVVEMRGYQQVEPLKQMLLNSHVFVIASLLENSPNSLCEAQRLGLPCVASYAGGIPDLVEGNKTGLLFPAGDAALLASHIRRLFNNKILAQTLGRNARKAAALRHNPEQVVGQLTKAYTCLLETRDLPPEI
jgi:glycosyltransferase involved in cell wall biosynthesis